MNMTDIQCFIKVTELMSFTKAAEALYTSQQAVSLHIKHLENTYKVQLFERKPSLKLTTSGQALLEAARDIIERENRLINQFTTMQDDFVGEIVIGLPPNRSTAFVCEFIPHFSREYPNMTIHLVEKTSPDLSAAVKNNEIDIALLLVSKHEYFDPDLYEIIPLETEDLYLIISDELLCKYFSQQYPYCKSIFIDGVSVTDFSHVPMFLHPATSRLHKAIVSKLVQSGTPPFIRIKTSLTSSLVSLCAQGHGIFFSTPMLLKHLYETQTKCFESLNVFPVTEFQGTRKTLLLYHKNKYLNRPLLSSIDIIKQVYKEHRYVMDRLHSKEILLD